jgi:regulator of protease activity HflC (stomatin/prohibitin superfamily)
MSEQPDRLPYSLEHWATESVQEKPNQGVLMTDHIQRTLVRYGLLLAALGAVVISSLALEYVRLLVGTATRLTGEATTNVWRWLAGMVPGLLGLAAVLGASTAFVRDVYGIRDWRSALGYVRLLLFGRAPLSLFDLKPSATPLAPYPFITVQQGRIDEKHEDTLLARLGGPGNAIVFNDSAVFLERFERFTRVAGPGQVFLQRFERIREVMDLRPQERSSVAKALTKDGIPVQTEVQVRFQLARPPASLVRPEPDVPHPVYKWALIHAGQCHLRAVNVDSGEESIAHWPERASGVGGTMRALIAEYRLDELLEPYEPGRDPRREIAQRLFQKLEDGGRNFGAQILEVRMGALEPTLEEVKKERITSWQAAWISRARREDALGKAEAIRERGLARAYAQMEIILSLAREFQDAVERKVALPGEIVILRFMESLRQTWSRPASAFVSSQVFKMWQSLQEDLNHLVGHDRLLPQGEMEMNEPSKDQEDSQPGR